MKRLLLFVLALGLILGLCACASSSKTEPKPTEQTADATPAPGTEPPEGPNDPTPAPGTEPPEGPNDPDYEGTPAEFVGSWQYEDRGGYIEIYDDWLWALFDENSDWVMTGGCRLEEGYGLVLGNGDGTDYDYLQSNGDGTLYNSAFTVLYPYEEPEPSGEAEDIPEGFIGSWLNEGNGYTVVISADGTWTAYDADGALAASGTCSYNSTYGLVLENEDGTDYDFLRQNDDGTLYNSCFDTLVPEYAETTPDTYVGPWYSGDAGVYLYVYDDMTWATFDEHIEYIAGGTCRLEDGFGLVLENFDGTDYDYLVSGDDGTLYDSCYDIYVPCGDFLNGEG